MLIPTLHLKNKIFKKIIINSIKNFTNILFHLVDYLPLLSLFLSLSYIHTTNTHTSTHISSHIHVRKMLLLGLFQDQQYREYENMGLYLYFPIPTVILQRNPDLSFI